MIVSVMFEFLEYSLEHQLPNFSECWWDHVGAMASRGDRVHAGDSPGVGTASAGHPSQASAWGWVLERPACSEALCPKAQAAHGGRDRGIGSPQTRQSGAVGPWSLPPAWPPAVDHGRACLQRAGHLLRHEDP